MRINKSELSKKIGQLKGIVPSRSFMFGRVFNRLGHKSDR